MSACRHCEAPIQWGCRANQWLPLNADGSQHHCSGRRRTQDVNHLPGKPIVGTNYRPSCGECDVPPWEVCACSALMRAAA